MKAVGVPPHILSSPPPSDISSAPARYPGWSRMHSPLATGVVFMPTVDALPGGKIAFRNVTPGRLLTVGLYFRFCPTHLGRSLMTAFGIPIAKHSPAIASLRQPHLMRQFGKSRITPEV